MFHFAKILAAVIVAFSFLADTAFAQNVNARAAWANADVSLRAGFLPDPVILRGRAGGDWYFTTTQTCRRGGWFANAPDARLRYQAGGMQLSFYVRAPGDTMLLINAPNGSWHCNDDYSGLDPAIVFNRPMSGRYEIWVGTYDRRRVNNARLYITEYGPFAR